jgi:two-component system OmpR family response regulator/two-component system alkaline phosphatase synthesis response regulator PhoP
MLLSQHLHSDGFAIDECVDGREALERLMRSAFDLIVVDAALSGLDGIALCRAVRNGVTNPDAAIFVVAGSGAESDKVLAFVNGADDYLTKPLSVREFLARVSAVMRRIERTAERHPRSAIHRADLRLDPSRREVVVRGQLIACSRQEFELLYALASSPGIVFSREELLARYWPKGGPKDVRLVDPIVSRLRRKIEREADTPQMILTVWGIGYKFTE